MHISFKYKNPWTIDDNKIVFHGKEYILEDISKVKLVTYPVYDIEITYRGIERRFGFESSQLDEAKIAVDYIRKKSKNILKDEKEKELREEKEKAGKRKAYLCVLLSTPILLILTVVCSSPFLLILTLIAGIVGSIGFGLNQKKLTDEELERLRQYNAEQAQRKAQREEAKQNKDASVVGRAVIGGVVAGPAGAVVGALSAVDKNNRKKKD